MWKKIVLLGFFGLSFLPVCVRAVTTHTVRVDGLVHNPKGAIAHVSTVPVSSGNFYAGEIYGLLDGNSFLTYCVELFQGASIGVTYIDYTIVSGVMAWGAPKSVALDHLMSYIALTGYGGNTAQSATVQATVWEIIQETAVVPYGFTTGTLKECS